MEDRNHEEPAAIAHLTALASWLLLAAARLSTSPMGLLLHMFAFDLPVKTQIGGYTLSVNQSRPTADPVSNL